MIRPSILVVVSLCVLALGCIGYWFALEGLMSGVVEYPTKYGQRLVSLADFPKTYWACVLFWLATGVALTVLCFINLKDACRRDDSR